MSDVHMLCNSLHSSNRIFDLIPYLVSTLLCRPFLLIVSAQIARIRQSILPRFATAFLHYSLLAYEQLQPRVTHSLYASTPVSV
jgi:hypothetical protein